MVSEPRPFPPRFPPVSPPPPGFFAESRGVRLAAEELMAQIWAEVLLDYRQALRKVILEHVLNEEPRRRWL